MELVIGESVKETNRIFIRDYTNLYCEAITENYRLYHINSMERMLAEDRNSSYAKEQLKSAEDGTANLMKFEIREGKKYYKIVQVEFRTEYGDSSVHSFVDKNTGEVYKPASWNSPAKHVRYDMRIITHRQACHDPKVTTWTGGFLYMR